MSEAFGGIILEPNAKCNADLNKLQLGYIHCTQIIK